MVSQNAALQRGTNSPSISHSPDVQGHNSVSKIMAKQVSDSYAITVIVAEHKFCL